jgi:hypothetical protein
MNEPTDLAEVAVDFSLVKFRAPPSAMVANAGWPHESGVSKGHAQSLQSRSLAERDSQLALPASDTRTHLSDGGAVKA